MANVKAALETPETEDAELTREIVRHLAAGIVGQAVDDWRMCVMHELDTTYTPVRFGFTTIAPKYVGTVSPRNPPVRISVTYAEIKQFFMSDYGAQLCEQLGLDNKHVYRKLYLLREHSKRKGYVAKGKGHEWLLSLQNEPGEDNKGTVET